MRSKLFKVFSVLITVVLLAVTAGDASTNTVFTDRPTPPIYPAGYHPPVPTGRTTPASVSNGAAEDGPVTAQAAYTGKAGMVFAYARTFGESEVAYFEDFAHINGPNGLAFSDTGELFVVEENGARLIKYGTYAAWFEDEQPLWSVGKAGLHDWGATGLNYPRGIAVAPDGATVWVADSDIISQFDAGTGIFLQRMPEEPWKVEDDNYRFQDARGIAFDSEGRMYVSDINRQRVQIFDIVDGTPIFNMTLPGNFNSPAGIEFDDNDNLFIADVNDFTVKQCSPDKTGGWPWNWNCVVFYGVSGEQGDSTDGSHLGVALGLGINLEHDVVYIADGGSRTMLRCTIAAQPGCQVIVQEMGWPADVAVDPTDSTLTLSDASWNGIFRFFGEEDLPPGIFTGDPRSPWLSNYPENEPYLTDDLHFNGPSGVEVDALGNLYVVEEQGQRLTKLDKNGDLVWNFGDPGIAGGEDTNRLDWPRAVALDKRNILIVGGSGSRVRLYSATNGAYIDTLDQGWGEDPFQFGDVWGVATDSSNLIYVSDQKTNRVKVFSYTPTATPKFKYIRQIGVGGDCSNRNDSFCSPRGIFVDVKKNLYVADHDNCRVQMFNSKGIYVKTFGTGMCRDTMGSVGGPADVAVDAQGRVYIVEEWNPRVQVFDKSGAYLTTIGGVWGAATGALRSARSIAIDKPGNVYLGDFQNARVQKYAPGVPYWAQMNINGFGKRNVSIFTLGTFKGSLYAGGTNEYNQAAIWKRVGTNWTPVIMDGFDDGANRYTNHLLEYKGFLYAITGNCTNEECSTSNGGQMWRSADGLNWQVVVHDGFRNQSNAELFRLAVLNGKLCVSTWGIGSDGGELWCSVSGEIGSWERVVEDGFGVSGNKAILSMVDYKPPLPNTTTYSYASTLNAYGYAHVWRKAAGSDQWQPLWSSWPDDGRYFAASGLTVYNNYLYVVVRTEHVNGLPDVGATIYRCQKCDGSDWAEALPVALQNPASKMGYALEATSNGLYAFIGNEETGLDILYTKDGVTWTRPFLAGLGNSANQRTYWDNAVITMGKSLYMATLNYDNGSGIWKLCPTTKVCK